MKPGQYILSKNFAHARKIFFKWSRLQIPIKYNLNLEIPKNPDRFF